MTSTNTFDASKSHISNDAMQTWLSESVLFDLNSVPGMGTKSTKTLTEGQIPDTIRITNAYGLIGIFLALTEEGQTMQQHCDAFMNYLAKHELHHNNHMICSAIASKVGVLFPNLYSREKLVTAGGKASASPAVGASPVIPGA